MFSDIYMKILHLRDLSMSFSLILIENETKFEIKIV